MINRVSRAWLVPLAASVLFLGMLIFEIPYATGYGWAKIPIFPLLIQMWAMPDWGHALFVPFICLFLVYSRRREILQAPIRGNVWGGVLILLGVFTYCLGLKAETEYFGFAAIQLLLAGLVLWFWGPKVFGIVSFAWFFFMFTWPMPFLDSVVALPLRLVMSHTANTLLNLLGTPCAQSGTAILSAPDPVTKAVLGQKFQIDIADPCSGLHSLFALMMISALAGYISVHNLWLRWLIFAAAIPLAIAGNVVRIILLVWGTERFGSSFAVGTEENPSSFHMGCGYVVYLVALMLLLCLISLINSPRLRRQEALGAAAI